LHSNSKEKLVEVSGMPFEYSIVGTLEKQDMQTLQFAVVAVASKYERGLLIPEDRILSETNLPSRTMLQCNQIEKHDVG
jgi:hypothetical protein